MRHRLGPIAILAILAATLAPSFAAAQAETTLALTQVCLPQLPSCEPPAVTCGLRVPPGGFVNVSVRAMREGRPQPSTPLVLEPGGIHALTDRAGMARFSIPPADGTVEFTIAAEGHEPSIRLALTWTSATVLVDSAPVVATIGNDTAFRFRILAAADGTPIEGAAVLLAGSEGYVSSTDPSGAEGWAFYPLAHHGPYEESFRIVDVDACGLPLSAPIGPLDLTWSTSQEALAPPALAFPQVTWLRSHVVPYVLTGGEPPVRVEWHATGETEWREGTITLPDGEHEVFARAVDARGREFSVFHLARIDALGPSIVRRYTPPGTPCGDVSLQVSDAHSGLDPSSVRVADRGVLLNATADATGLVELRLGAGLHSLVASARDRAGNPGATALELRCDATPPRAEAQWNESTWIRCEQIQWKLFEDATELDRGSLQVLTDGVLVPAVLEGTRVLPRVSEGRHTLTLIIQDAAGNRLERSDVVQCDATPPMLSPAPRGVVINGYVTTWSGLDPGASDNASGIASIRARVDGGSWMSPEAIQIEGEGERAIEVEATDAIGRTSNATILVSVDALPPKIEIPATITAGKLLAGRIHDGASGVDVFQAIFPDGVTKSIEIGSEGTFSLAIPTGVARILLTAGDRAGNNLGIALQVEPPAPSPPTSSLVPAANDSKPPATPPQAPRAIYRLQAIAVTPLNLDLPQEVRVSGIADGIQGGTAILVDEQGGEHELGTVELAGRNFTASGKPPAPGAYTVKIRFETLEGDIVPHEVGTIHVDGMPPAQGQHAIAVKTPGPGLLLLALGLILGALMFRRPQP